MKTPQAKTVPELLAQIRQKAKGGDYIFRGEAKKHTNVTSGLYGLYEDTIKAKKFDIEIVEKEVIHDAKKHTHEKDDNAILEQLQHYGGKTNQIDFSTDYLVALFFACNGNYEKNGRLILLNKKEINKKGVKTRPPTNPQNRVIAQKSIFVIPPKGFIKVKSDDVIIVPKKLKEDVQKYLKQYHNIKTATIYNDIHGYITQTKIHESAYTHFYCGFTYQNKGKFPQAIKEYNEAIKLNPNFAAAYANRGGAYAGKRNYARAITDLNKAIELDQDNVIAYINRGGAYANKRNYARALVDLDKAIELDPSDANAYNNRGGVYIAKRNYARAIVDLDKAIELDPSNANAYNNRGLSYKNIGDYDKAIADFNKAIEIIPNFAPAYNNRGITKKASKDIKGAREDLDTALRLAKKQKNKPFVNQIQKEIDKLPPA